MYFRVSQTVQRSIYISWTNRCLFINLIFILARVSKYFWICCPLPVCPSFSDHFSSTGLCIIGINHPYEKCALFASHKSTNMLKNCRSPQKSTIFLREAFLLNFVKTNHLILKKVHQLWQETYNFCFRGFFEIS